MASSNPHKAHPALVYVPSKEHISYTEARAESIRDLEEFDLCTPDGKVVFIERSADRREARCVVQIDNISKGFLGWDTDGSPSPVYFNLKSTISQLGINGIGEEYNLRYAERSATVTVLLRAISSLGVLMLDNIGMNTFIGKLFSPHPARRISSPDAIHTMLTRVDRRGQPILCLGKGRGTDGRPDWSLDVVGDRLICHVSLKPGWIQYDGSIHGLLPTVGKALGAKKKVKHLLRLHQIHNLDLTRLTRPNEMLMVRTKSLYIRSCFVRIAEDLLPKGVYACSSNVVEPATSDYSVEEELAGRTFCFYGEAMEELKTIPFEFYRLEHWRAHTYFDDKDGLREALESPEGLFEAFSTAPQEHQVCVYIANPVQLTSLVREEWVQTNPQKEDYPGIAKPERQRELARRYLQQQCCYGVLKALSTGDITSHGVLLLRYLPSPVLKHLLLSDTVSQCLKRIYFLKASQSHGDFLSHGDRSMLLDLSTFGVEVFQVDLEKKTIFEYMHKPGRDNGSFVPVYPTSKVEEYLEATVLGVYGSNLLEGDFEREMEILIKGMLEMRHDVVHELLHPKKPLAVVTGGGPGAMELGNRVAKKLGVLSCGNICDFRPKTGGTVNEQKRNPFVEVYMTYRLEKLVERQSEFNLDFPIFLVGGIGTDFEFALEEVRRKVGTTPPRPIILFGSVEHWSKKISGRFQENIQQGVIKGSEWLSNCSFVVQTGEQALKVYRMWFRGDIVTGPSGPIYHQGFCVVPRDVSRWDGKSL